MVVLLRMVIVVVTVTMAMVAAEEGEEKGALGHLPREYQSCQHAQDFHRF